MLDAFIIDMIIKKREKADEERPVLQLPIPDNNYDIPEQAKEKLPPREMIIIEF